MDDKTLRESLKEIILRGYFCPGARHVFETDLACGGYTEAQIARVIDFVEGNFVQDEAHLDRMIAIFVRDLIKKEALSNLDRMKACEYIVLLKLAASSASIDQG